MVRAWSENDPKAGLAARKRTQIVDAARRSQMTTAATTAG
jgi:hypothetical protein